MKRLALVIALGATRAWAGEPEVLPPPAESLYATVTPESSWPLRERMLSLPEPVPEKTTAARCERQIEIQTRVVRVFPQRRWHWRRHWRR